MDDSPDTFDEQPEWVTSWLAKKAEAERAECVPTLPLPNRMQAAIDRIEAFRAAKRARM
jgi:hypothetical protein